MSGKAGKVGGLIPWIKIDVTFVSVCVTIYITLFRSKKTKNFHASRKYL